jgi:VCBS repeat-containing protein
MLALLRPLLILLALLTAVPALRAEEPAVALVGIGSAAIQLTPQALSAMPAAERDVTFETSKGPATRHYKGVLLWNVLQANKALDGLKPAEQLKKTFLVSARDGYQIAFSIGEIHPDFGNLPLILVTAVDGNPLDGGWRLVAPGDKRGARAVYEVVKIELR